MKNYFNKSQNKSRAAYYFIALFLLLATTFAPLTHTLKPQHAEAQMAVLDAANLVQTTITAGSSVVDESRKGLLNGIAWSVAKQAVNNMTQSIVQWINSGFEGSPAFVTDLEGFLTNIADQIAGEFIQGSELGFLCSPFKLDIKLALQTNYANSKGSNFGKRTSCTLSGVVGNMENFIQGSFAEGGWDGWFQLTQNAQNNPYGAYEIAEAEMRARIVTAQGQEIKLLEFGQGFLSYKDCSTGSGGWKTCTVKTPGQVISQQLNKSLGLGQDTLVEADQINEIISALIGQLAQQAITGAGGLLGTTQSQGSGQPSFLNDPRNQQSTIGLRDTTGSPVVRSLAIERDVLEAYEDIIMIVDDGITDFAAQESCRITNTFPRSIEREQGRARDARESVQLNIQILMLADEIMDNPLATGADQQEAYNAYLTLQKDGDLHTESDLDDIRDNADDVDARTQEFMFMINDECNAIE